MTDDLNSETSPTRGKLALVPLSTSSAAAPASGKIDTGRDTVNVLVVLIPRYKYDIAIVFFRATRLFCFFFAIDSCYFEVRGNGIDGEINGGGILRGVYGSK